MASAHASEAQRTGIWHRQLATTSVALSFCDLSCMSRARTQFATRLEGPHHVSESVSTRRSSDLELKSRRHEYTLFLGIDGNYRAVLKQKRHDLHDIPLLDGRGYFVNTEDFDRYVGKVPDDPDDVTGLFPLFLS